MNLTIIQALRSRTVQFSIALAVLSLLQGFVIQLPIPPWGHAVVGSVIAAAVVVLRVITTQPLSQK
ncbi:MAG: hypothetical protein ING31_12190 [Burkholderiales bacterium]|nr:hypothetical protein [Burkholderiales bacterium]